MAFGEQGYWPSTANHRRMILDFFVRHPKVSFSRLGAMGRGIWSLEHYPEVLTCCFTSRITNFVFCWSMCGPLSSSEKDSSKDIPMVEGEGTLRELVCFPAVYLGTQS